MEGSTTKNIPFVLAACIVAGVCDGGIVALIIAPCSCWLSTYFALRCALALEQKKKNWVYGDARSIAGDISGVLDGLCDEHSVRAPFVVDRMVLLEHCRA